MTYFTESKPRALEPTEHPNHLLIDQVGVYLGKRSERVLVRWKPPIPKKPRAHVLAFPDQDSSDETNSKSVSIDDQDDATVTSREMLSLWKPMMETESGVEEIEHRSDRLQRQLNELAEPSLPNDSSASDPMELASGEWMLPMYKLSSVTLAGGGITISSDLIAALVERGIHVSFVSRVGQPVGQLYSPGLNGSVQTRRAQLAAYETSLGVELAVQFVAGKLRNQKHQLQYSGKYLKNSYPERYERLERKIASIVNVRRQLKGFRANSLEEVRDKLLGYEGTGARLYWEGVAIVLEEKYPFPGRKTRGAIDPINAGLNYGYGILYSQVAAAVANAGLELFAGFLHTDRPGKPALVLDLVEEFRAPIVDRVILSMVNQGIAMETDEYGLTTSCKRAIAKRILQRLATRVPYEGKNWPLSAVIQIQARHLAVAIRGERTYRSFASRW